MPEQTSTKPTGTAIYLEGFKSKNLPKHKDGKTKAEFIKKSGPESADGFKKEVIEDSCACEQERNSPYVPNKLSQKKEKTVTEKINNSRNMSNQKSEFDKLCENVLGPESMGDMGAGSDSPETGLDDAQSMGEENGLGETPNEGGDGDLKEKVGNILQQVKDLFVELGGDPDACADDSLDKIDGEEGADTIEDFEPEGEEGAPAPTKESVEAEDWGTPITGQKKGNPDKVTGKANVVDGDASKVSKGTADGKIQKPGTGETEKAPSGEAQVGNPKSSNAVKSKITGKNQPLFH